MHTFEEVTDVTLREGKYTSHGMCARVWVWMCVHHSCCTHWQSALEKRRYLLPNCFLQTQNVSSLLNADCLQILGAAGSTHSLANCVKCAEYSGTPL